jgi:hypothetical protein
MKHETWHVRPDYGQENVYRIWDVDDNYHKDTSPEMMDKRAQLIACAPELLEALTQELVALKHWRKVASGDILEGIHISITKIEIAIAATKPVKCTCKPGSSYVAANCKALEHKP